MRLSCCHAASLTQDVDDAVMAARAQASRPMSARDAATTDRLVDVLAYQGYSDADERFHAVR